VVLEWAPWVSREQHDLSALDFGCCRQRLTDPAQITRLFGFLGRRSGAQEQNVDQASVTGFEENSSENPMIRLRLGFLAGPTSSRFAGSTTLLDGKPFPSQAPDLRLLPASVGRRRSGLALFTGCSMVPPNAALATSDSEFTTVRPVPPGEQRSRAIESRIENLFNGNQDGLSSNGLRTYAGPRACSGSVPSGRFGDFP
jgi:hypothetical protein